MNNSIPLRICIAALLATAVPASAAPSDAAHASALPYRVADRFPIGGDGKWDYPSVDSTTQRLYLSRATHVVIVDTQTGRIAGDIPDTPGVHGIAIAPELGRGYVSMGKSDRVKVFDLKTLDVIATVEVGAKPDAILYEPQTRQVFVFNGHGGNASVIDAADNKVVATIDLGGTPEFARADGAGNVYVNIENKNELAALDAKRQKVTARWPLPGCEGPAGLALDSTHHRSFSACANSKMSILDLDTGRSVATIPIGAGVDGAEFDADSQNAFSANGEGTLTVVHEENPEHFAVAQILSTARGARTIALDASRHKLYLPTARFETAATEAGEPKGPVAPGSFFVLVVDDTPVQPRDTSQNMPQHMPQPMP
jgi:YVTN family beta-propeller protein